MLLIQPLASRGVELLARTRVERWQVVVSHALIGLLAAVLVAGSSASAWFAAAVLLQLKTLLDNMDGGLARATNRVTELGRYLDTGLDFVVNIALFMALAQHGPPPLAVLALVVLTVVLSYDFNAERLYRQAHREDRAKASPPAPAPLPDAAPNAAAGSPTAAPGAAPESPTAANGAAAESPALRLFRGLYQALFAPQDAAIAALDARLFALASTRDYRTALTTERRAWSNLFSTASLVNLGLSSQYVVLGVCLLVGIPFAYVYLVLLQGVYVVVVQLLRVRSYRRRAAPAHDQPGGRG